MSQSAREWKAEQEVQLDIIAGFRKVIAQAEVERKELEAKLKIINKSKVKLDLHQTKKDLKEVKKTIKICERNIKKSLKHLTKMNKNKPKGA